ARGLGVATATPFGAVAEVLVQHFDQRRVQLNAVRVKYGRQLVGGREVFRAALRERHRARRLEIGFFYRQSATLLVQSSYTLVRALFTARASSLRRLIGGAPLPSCCAF